MASSDFYVSVIIPVYNAELWVEKAVHSALQFEEVREVLLIEDGSPDNALEVCKKISINSPKVKLLQHSDGKNHGAEVSRNLGILNATSAYVSFLDADDFYLPTRFDRDKIIFSKNPDADGVYNAVGPYFYTKGGEKAYRKTYKQIIHSIHVNAEPKDLFPGLSSMIGHFGFIHIDGLTVKKSTLQKMDKLFLQGLFPHEDTEFFIRLAYYSNLYGGETVLPVALRGVHDMNNILAIEESKEKIKLTRYRLWSTLYEWAKQENLSETKLNHFRLMKRSREITTYPLTKALKATYKEIYYDKEIFLKNIYYNNLHEYFFGGNFFSRLLLKIKNNIQTILGFPCNMKKPL